MNNRNGLISRSKIVSSTLNDAVILVTGGAGAIGSNLVKKLLTEGNYIIVLDDLSSGYKDILPVHKNVIFVQGSITDDVILKKVFSITINKKKISVIYHLAALFANQNSVDHPELDLLVNGLGTLKLLEYAQRHGGIDRFIYTSSSCVYGNLSSPAKEDSVTFHPDTPYAITKLLGERYVNYFHQFYGMNTVILRIFNSFGPGEKSGKYRNVIPNMFARAIRKEPLVIYGTGKETRDFNWIDNLMQVFILAAKKNAAIGETFNVGSGKETTIFEIAQHINEITNNPAGITYLPVRDWDVVKRRCANILKAKKLLGYNPDISDIHDKLIQTYDWIKKHGI